MQPDNNNAQPIDGALLAQVTPIPAEPTAQVEIIGNGHPEMMIPTKPITHAEGEGMIKAGDNYARVEHGLPSTPHVVVSFPDPTLTPDDPFWENGPPCVLVNINPTTFQLNFFTPRQEDTRFTWVADI